MSERTPTSTEQLLAHAGWLRALALRLVRDDDLADDLVQETWIATMRRAPERETGARSWLAKVMLNTLRMRARSEGRRAAREQATLLLDDEAVPSQDVVLARAEIQRKLVDLVLRLDEPYRTTVLLHFCEGLALASIARAQGVPASTVRTRLRTALEQLREGLDTQTGGRKQWAIPLLAKGVFVAQKTSKIAIAVIVLLLLVGGGLLWLRHRGAQPTHGEPGKGASVAGGSPRGATPIALGAEPDRPAWLIQPDVKPRRVAGRVTFRGAPVAGAIVELASLATEAGLGTAPHRTTNAAGEFDFGSQPAMQLSVRASAPSRAGAALAIDLRNPLVKSDHLELQLGACTAAMVGSVRDASGGPIAKARITRLELEDHGDVPGGTAVATDDNGSYELCVETRWPGWVTVEVSAAGYGTILHTAIVPGRVKVDFALVPEATIVGHVIRDDNRQPVPQAFVYVPAGPAGLQRPGWRAAFTDASGRFRIDRVAPGRHLVLARAEGLADTARGVPVDLEAGQTSTELEIRLQAGSTIRGRVVDGDKPIAGANVTPIAADGRHGRTAISQEDGSYVLTAVPRGEIKFAAMPYDVVKPQTFHVSEPLHDNVTIEVEALGTIIGHVVRRQRPAVGARISLRGPNDRELDPVRSDGDGRFVVHGLRPGPWVLFAESEHEGAFGRAPETVHLKAGQTAEVTIDIAFSASISGRVVDQNGAPVAGVNVQFHSTNSDDAGMAATAMDGTFRATTMTGGGQYRPVVSRTLPSTATLRPATGTEFPLVAVADGNTDITGVVLAVKLDQLTIAGHVVDAAGAPVADTRVAAALVEGNAEPDFFQGLQLPAATTDVDGQFSINELVAGTYALRAHAAAGVDGTIANVRAGRRDVVIVLPAPGAIEATTNGFKTAPQVTAIIAGGLRANAPLVATVAGNVASFRNVSPGSYLVTARTQQAEGASAIVEVTSGRTARVLLTSQGSGVVAGHVRDFRTNKPVEGMTCRALPRVGTTPALGAPGEGVRTDAQGAFLLDAPGGDIAVSCDGLWGSYSDGLRLITLPASQRVDIAVPVVSWRDAASYAIADMGAEFDDRVLVPRLVHVQPGGPAAVAGFLEGDVITSVDGASVAELSQRGVWVLVVNRAPGSKVKVTVTRAGKPIAGELVLR